MNRTLPFESVENEFLRVDYLTTLGPRILGLHARGVDGNLFAVTPEAHWSTPHGEYYLHGGHRLWTAPEDLFYMCPEDNVTVRSEGNLVSLSSRPDASGLEKEISFRLEGHRVRLLHRVTWRGNQPAEFAPWALTQMRMGGMAILPQSRLNTGRLPNRNLILWPYSRLDDERFELNDDLILVHGHPSEQAFKIGNYNPHGWAAYVLEKALFVKRFAVGQARPYPDMGCNVESYVRDTFVEVETLGPLAVLKPGASTIHEETWEVYAGKYSLTLDMARDITRQVFTQ